MRLHIESALATDWNERDPEDQRPNVWEGVVPDMNLEEVFRYFNRVDDEDVERLEALNYELPSLSVGDTVLDLDTGACHRVANVGWEDVPATPSAGWENA